MPGQRRQSVNATGTKGDGLHGGRATSRGVGDEASNSGYPMLVGVLVLLYAVYTCFFYTDWILDAFAAYKVDYGVARDIAIAGSLAVFALLVGLRIQVRLRPCLTIGYVLLAGSLALSAAALLNEAPAAVFNAAGALGGVGLGCTVPYTYAALAPYGQRRVAWGLSIAFGAGIALGTLFDLLSPLVSLALYGVALAASVPFLVRALWGRSAGLATTASLALGRVDVSVRISALVRTLFTPAVCMVVMCVLYGLFNFIARQCWTFPISPVPIFRLGGIVAAVAFVLYLKMFSATSVSVPLNITLGIMALGLLLLPFMPVDYTVFLNTLAAAGWKFALIILLYLVIVELSHAGRFLLVGIAAAYALSRITLGLVPCVGVEPHGSEADLFVVMAGIALVSLFAVFVVVLVCGSYERSHAESRARFADALLEQLAQGQQDAIKLRCAVLAREFSLTNRERDILGYVAQGRDAAFIGEHLSLTKSTVKSYQRSLYAKLGVHSRQEIIDVVHQTGRDAC